LKKIFECHIWSHTPLFLWENRQAAFAKFIGEGKIPVEHGFLLDTGAIISTMTRQTAEIHGVYDKNVVNKHAVVGGFTGKMTGRVISLDYLTLGKLAVRNTLFFVPDERIDVAEVLGSNVLNGLIPIPEFDKPDETDRDSKDRVKPRGRIWIIKNENIPKPYFSKNLGVSVSCEILSQDDEVRNLDNGHIIGKKEFDNDNPTKIKTR
jgi:hypothetical protein